MAVVGFEIDQVRRTPTGDVQVPITVAYNHHFESTMIGKDAVFESQELQGPKDPNVPDTHGHGMPLAWEPGDRRWVVKQNAKKSGEFPSSQAFGGANGGEFRKSFHGYAPGYVQVIQSPTQIQITPMQIDTWNREKMNISHPTRFVSGPVPRSSLAPQTGPDALYSGLLECPVTTRITKKVEGKAVLRVGGAPCGKLATSGEECLQLARTALPQHRLTPLQSAQEPGCFVAGDMEELDLVHVSFKAEHGRAAMQQDWRGRRPIPEALCGSDAKHFVGSSNPLVNVSVVLDLENSVAQISLEGPKDVWFGVGFAAQSMSDEPWAIIVDGQGEVSERKLGNHQAGTLLKASVTVKESQVVNSLRRVVLTRPLKGASSEYYSFNPLEDGGAQINFINAVGSGPTLSYHKHRTLGLLTLLPTSKTTPGACVCVGKEAPFGQAKGTMEYTASGPGDEGSGSVAFNNQCSPEPRSDLLKMQNPTCDLRNYSGGQIACHHMWSLLDADQPIPWTDQPIEYSLKMRFWVEEYDKSYHTMLQRVTWGIASPVEYDVPKCSEGMMGCSLQNGTWIHTIQGTFKGEGRLSAAHFHCHAPTCLSMQMYRCPLGTEVCNASTGELLCEEKPIYGHGEDDFGEPGYILQPPCLWGSEDFGLTAPPSVEGYVLGTVKTSNATYGHHGEMAWQQMYIFHDPAQRAESYI